MLADLPDEIAQFQRMLRRFVDSEVLPVEAQVMANGALSAKEHAAISAKAREHGLWLLDVPESLGGAGLGMLGLSIFWEEISRTVAIPARDYSVFGPSVGSILLSLTGELAEHFLYPVLRGEKTACFAQTEPEAGADPRRMRTRAVRDGDHYVINGIKRFITHARDADFAQVILKTSQAGSPDAFSCLLVELNAPGVRLGSQYDTMMGDVLDEIVFEDARVPVTNRVGAEGEGFRLAQSWINQGRIRHGARACGVAERCIAMTSRYAHQRVTFGEPLANRQALQWCLADSATEVHATRLMVRYAAALMDAGEEAAMESYMVKLYGDEMGFRVADRCLQFHGGMGLTLDLPISKMWRDQRSFMITEGPSEAMRMAIARRILAEHA